MIVSDVADVLYLQYGLHCHHHYHHHHYHPCYYFPNGKMTLVVSVLIVVFDVVLVVVGMSFVP